jgi:hypothetical protein
MKMPIVRSGDGKLLHLSIIKLLSLHQINAFTASTKLKFISP